MNIPARDSASHQHLVEIARAEQRQRMMMAEILHGDLQQWLVAARLRLAIAIQSGGAAPAVLKEVDSLLEQAIATGRGLAYELVPRELECSGLASALEGLGQTMCRLHGLNVSVRADAAANPKDAERARLLYHAARELLLNVCKHAGTSTAELTLEAIPPDALRLTIADAGRGFDESHLARARGSLGLGLLQRQIETLGGQFSVVSSPGKGTRVTLRTSVA